MKVKITIESEDKTVSYTENVRDSIDVEDLMDRCKSNLQLAAAMATLRRIGKS